MDTDHACPSHPITRQPRQPARARGFEVRSNPPGHGNGYCNPLPLSQLIQQFAPRSPAPNWRQAGELGGVLPGPAPMPGRMMVPPPSTDIALMLPDAGGFVTIEPTTAVDALPVFGTAGPPVLALTAMSAPERPGWQGS